MINTDSIELIKPTEIIGGCISIYRNIWENPNETIEQIEAYSNNPNAKYPFKNALNIEGQRITNRTNEDMSLTAAASDDEVMKSLSDRFFKTAWSTAIGYNEYYELEEQTYFIEGFNILKYQTGTEYKGHYDGGSKSGRSISPILYLNDNYEGGELEFVNFGIKIKPEAGMLVLFPATFPYKHIAHPVTSGTKYAIVTWLQDRPQDTLMTQI